MLGVPVESVEWLATFRQTKIGAPTKEVPCASDQFSRSEGWVGKSHLTANWAVEAATNGFTTVVIVDLDALQPSVSNWAKRRLERSGINNSITVEADMDTLEDIVGTCEERDVDLLFLDTKANIETPVRAATAIADMAIIPCGASMNEAMGIGPTVTVTKDLGVPAWIVMNKGRPRPQKSYMVAEALERYDLPVCPTIIFQRAAVEDAVDLGQTAGELAPRDKAVGEIAGSWGVDPQPTQQGECMTASKSSRMEKLASVLETLGPEADRSGDVGIVDEDTGRVDAPESTKLVPKQFSVTSEAYMQFNLLVAEQTIPGQPRPGPRLIAQALNMLFEKYGKDAVA